MGPVGLYQRSWPPVAGVWLHRSRIFGSLTDLQQLEEIARHVLTRPGLFCDPLLGAPPALFCFHTCIWLENCLLRLSHRS